MHQEFFCLKDVVVEVDVVHLKVANGVTARMLMHGFSVLPWQHATKIPYRKQQPVRTQNTSVYENLNINVEYRITIMFYNIKVTNLKTWISSIEPTAFTFPKFYSLCLGSVRVSHQIKTESNQYMISLTSAWNFIEMNVTHKVYWGLGDVWDNVWTFVKLNSVLQVTRGSWVWFLYRVQKSFFWGLGFKNIHISCMKCHFKSFNK